MSKFKYSEQSFLSVSNSDIIDSGICTCYYEPQARKNRIPSFFEELEPRQLLSGTVINTNNNSKIVVADTCSNELSSKANMQAENAVMASNNAGDIGDNTGNTVTDNVSDIWHDVVPGDGSVEGVIEWAKEEFMEYVTSGVDATNLTSVAAAWGTITASDVDDYDLEGWTKVNQIGTYDENDESSASPATSGNITIGSDGNLTIIGDSINSVDTAKLPYYYSYTYDTITLTGDFIGAEGVDSFGLLTNGDVIFESNVSFIGISEIVIVADSITFDGTTYIGGSLTLSALGDVTFTEGTQLLAVEDYHSSNSNDDIVDATENLDISISCLGTVSIAENVQIKQDADRQLAYRYETHQYNTEGTNYTNIADANFNNFTINAPNVIIGSAELNSAKTTINVNGNFTINAHLESKLLFNMMFSPVRILEGSVSVAIHNADIEAGSIYIEASIESDTGTFKEADFSNQFAIDWADEFEKAYYLNANDALQKYFGVNLKSTIPTLDTNIFSLNGITQAIVSDVQSVLAFYISYINANAEITIDDDVTLTSTEGDVSIVASSDIKNNKNLDTVLFGFILGINENTVNVRIDGKIDSARDIIITSSEKVVNFIDLDTSFNTTLAGLGLKIASKCASGFTVAFGASANIASATLVISDKAELYAERDIIAHAQATGDYSSMIHCAPSSKSFLSSAININYNDTSANLSIDGVLHAQGSVEGTSSALVDYYSSTDNNDILIPLQSWTVADYAIDGVGVLVAAAIYHILDPITSSLGIPLETSALGIAFALGLNGTTSNTVIGRNAVITAEGTTLSQCLGGLGSVTLTSSAISKPTMSVYSGIGRTTSIVSKVLNVIKDTSTVELDTNNNFAIGIGNYINDAITTVDSGAHITAKTLVDIRSDGTIGLPTPGYEPIITFTKESFSGGELIQSEYLLAAQSIATTALEQTEKTYIDGAMAIDDIIEDIIGIKVLAHIDFPNGLAITSHVKTNTVGASDAAKAASVSYTGQFNTAMTTIHDGAVIVKTGGLTDDAINNNTIQLQNNYYDDERDGNYVTYMVEDGCEAIEGLTIGETYWGDVDTNNLLNLYKIDASGNRIGGAIDLAPPRIINEENKVVHFFLFNVKDPNAAESDNKKYDVVSFTKPAKNVLDIGEDHGFVTGDIITYTASQDALLGELKDGATYIVYATSSTAFSLKQITIADDKSYSIAENFVSFGSGNVNADELSNGHLFTPFKAEEYTGLAQAITSTNFIEANSPSYDNLSGFKSGDLLTYSSEDGETLDGLDNGAKYYLVVMDTNTFGLVTEGGDMVRLTVEGTGVHTFTREDGEKIIVTAGSATAQTINVAAQGSITATKITAITMGMSSVVQLQDNTVNILHNGDIVEYNAVADGKPAIAISGLENGKKYRVTIIDNDFSLQAVDAEDNAVGEYISIDGCGRGLEANATHTFKIISSVTNANVVLDALADDEQLNNNQTFFIGEHSYNTGDKVVLKTLTYSIDDESNPNYSEGPLYEDVDRNIIVPADFESSEGYLLYGGQGESIYSVTKEYIVEYVSSSMIKLYDTKNGAYATHEDIKDLTNTSEIYAEYIIERSEVGSGIVTDTKNGNLTVSADTFAVDDAVIYTSFVNKDGEKNTTSTLISGKKYYIASVTDNNDGTASITLSETKGGNALTVTIKNDENASLTLSTTHTYTASIIEENVEFTFHINDDEDCYVTTDASGVHLEDGLALQADGKTYILTAVASLASAEFSMDDFLSAKMQYQLKDSEGNVLSLTDGEIKSFSIAMLDFTNSHELEDGTAIQDADGKIYIISTKSYVTNIIRDADGDITDYKEGVAYQLTDELGYIFDATTFEGKEFTKAEGVTPVSQADFDTVEKIFVAPEGHGYTDGDIVYIENGNSTSYYSIVRYDHTSFSLIFLGKLDNGKLVPATEEEKIDSADSSQYVTRAELLQAGGNAESVTIITGTMGIRADFTDNADQTKTENANEEDQVPFSDVFVSAGLGTLGDQSPVLNLSDHDFANGQAVTASWFDFGALKGLATTLKLSECKQLDLSAFGIADPVDLTKYIKLDEFQNKLNELKAAGKLNEDIPDFVDMTLEDCTTLPSEVIELLGPLGGLIESAKESETYYVIKIDNNNIKLATSQDNALRGIADYSLKGKKFSIQAVKQRYGVYVDADTTAETINVTGQTGVGAGNKRLITETIMAGQTSILGLLSSTHPPARSAAGGTIQIVNEKYNTTALVDKGVTIVADGLSITADSHNTHFLLALSGAKAQTTTGGTEKAPRGENSSLSPDGAVSVCFSGLFVDGTTLATLNVDSPSIALGNRAMGDGLDSLVINAYDFATYGQIGFSLNQGSDSTGGVAFTQISVRDVNANLVGIAENNGGASHGEVSVLGTADVNAETDGRTFALMLSPTIASTSTIPDGDKPQKPSQTQESPKEDAFGFKNFFSTDGLTNIGITGKANVANYLSELRAKTENIGRIYTPNVEGGVKLPESAQTNKGHTGELFLGVDIQNTNVLVDNLKSLAVAGFTANAFNKSDQIVLAGAIAFAFSNNSTETSVAAGTFIANGVSRNTSAIVQGIETFDIHRLNNVSHGIGFNDGNVSIDARNSGLSILAGASASLASSGNAYGGSVLINAQGSNTVAKLVDSNLNMLPQYDADADNGFLQITSTQDSMMVTIAGGGSLGGSIGLGFSGSVNVLWGDTVAGIENSNVTSHGDVTVKAVRGLHDFDQIFSDLLGTKFDTIDTDNDDTRTDEKIKKDATDNVRDDAISDEVLAGEANLETMPFGFNLISVGASAGTATGRVTETDTTKPTTAASLAASFVINVAEGDTLAYITVTNAVKHNKEFCENSWDIQAQSETEKWKMDKVST